MQMRCATLLAFTLAAAAILAPARLSAQASPLSGHWRIDFTTDSSSKRPPRTIRGVIQLRDTLVARRGDPQARTDSVLVGEYLVDFPSVGANPIGRGVGGAAEPSGKFWARLGEGYDRGEVELHGHVEGDTVVGEWIIVRGETASLQGGSFVMRR
jgi:hypothetical protein